MAGAVTLGFLLRTIGARSKELATLDLALTKFPKDPRLELARLNLLVEAAADEKSMIGAADKAAADLPDNDVIQGVAGSVYARFQQFDKAAGRAAKSGEGESRKLSSAPRSGRSLPGAEKTAGVRNGIDVADCRDASPFARHFGASLRHARQRPRRFETLERSGRDVRKRSGPSWRTIPRCSTIGRGCWRRQGGGDRNPKKALDLATKAVSLSRQRNASMIDTLAEAYFAEWGKR